jgi:hypothetical protein
VIREIPTPNYGYRMMTSGFVERRNPARLLELTLVEIRGPGASQTWWFEVAGTHPPLRMEHERGERIELQSIERRAYWLRPG